jgi:MEDS: MEthanogen/methylotroph, DcmR Sensory domain
MLYDDEKRADLVIARYFLDGLEKGASCVFFTDEDPAAIRRRLASQGVDVGRYEKEKRLRVFRIESADSGKVDVMRTLKAIRAESTKGMKPPFRFVGRTITDVESVNGMLQGMTLEKIGNDHFAEFDNSQLCFYDIRKMERSRRDEWVKGLLENHHSVIYASEPTRPSRSRRACSRKKSDVPLDLRPRGWSSRSRTSGSWRVRLRRTLRSRSDPDEPVLGRSLGARSASPVNCLWPPTRTRWPRWACPAESSA